MLVWWYGGGHCGVVSVGMLVAIVVVSVGVGVGSIMVGIVIVSADITVQRGVVGCHSGC